MKTSILSSKYCSTLVRSARSNISVSSSSICQRKGLRIGIIGAPTCAGQSKNGVELGPSAIRSSGLVKQIKFIGHDVVDFGDCTSYPTKEGLSQDMTNAKLKNEISVRQMFHQLSSLVTKVVKEDRIPVTLGGDHSTAIASISANASNNNDMKCVVWVDAHADMNTVETTATGHFHGMASSFLIRQVQHIFNNPNKNCLPIKPCIDAKNIVFIGLRDVQSCELEIINKTKITYFTTQDIDKVGINEVIARALDKINPQLNRKIHVSFDIDAIDPMSAPSTGTPVYGGLTLREALCIGEQIHSTNMLCGLDLVEVNPAIGDQIDVKRTVESGIATILAFLGKNRVNENIGLSHNSNSLLNL